MHVFISQRAYLYCTKYDHQMKLLHLENSLHQFLLDVHLTKNLRKKLFVAFWLDNSTNMSAILVQSVIKIKINFYFYAAA